jgi:hypothetical protein
MSVRDEAMVVSPTVGLAHRREEAERVASAKLPDTGDADALETTLDGRSDVRQGLEVAGVRR